MMNKALSMLIAISMLVIVVMPVVNAIQTDTIYVGQTGAIGGYNTFDYDAQRYGDYIVWTRALDIHDTSGNVNPDGKVSGSSAFYEPSWVMIQKISTGVTWNATPDFDAGLRVSPNIYYHAESVTVHDNKVLYEYSYSTYNSARTLYMYNITTNETWKVPTPTYQTHGYEHKIYGDWIFYTTYPSGREIYVYNYETGEGRRVDGGATTNGYIGLNHDFVWFSDRTTSPNYLKIISLQTAKVTEIKGINVGLHIYASSETSPDGRYLGVFTYNGADRDSYLLDLEGMNVTSDGANELIFWEDIDPEHLIIVDENDAYDSFAPFTDGYYAVYTHRVYQANVIDMNNDISIYNIRDNETRVLAGSSHNEYLTHYYGSVVLYHTNQNSFIQNNDAGDDFDIYRTVSDTENIGNTIWSYAPFILIMLVVGFILGAFKLFGSAGFDGGGGML